MEATHATPPHGENPSFARFWQRLTAPPAHLTDDEAQRRARLLNALLLIIIPVGWVIIALILINNPLAIRSADTWATLAALITAKGLYLYHRRSGKTNHTALVVVLITWAIFTITPFIPATRDALVYFNIITLLIAAIFFNARFVLWLAVASALTMLVLVNFADAPRWTFTRAFYAVQYTAAATAMLLTFMNHLQGVERSRRHRLEQANAALRASEALLEQRVLERTAQVERAYRESEVLYQVSQSINAVQSYVGIVEAIAKYMDDPQANIGLALYENFDKSSATYFEMVALRPANATQAVARDRRFEAHRLENWTLREIVVVEDMNTTTLISPEDIAFYRENGVQAMMAVGLVLGERVIGILNVTSSTPRTYSDDERRFLRAVADIAAAAVERTRLYHEQVQVAEKLRAVDQMKSQFLASMSHELRTPLNAILNFTDFVALGMLGEVNDAQRDALQKSLDSGRHLLSLINDVLDMTKIEAGMMTLFLEDDVDPHAEIQQVIAATHSLIADRPITFVKDIDADLPHMRVDRRRLRQMLLNLLSNAIKFTEQGSVTLSVKNRGDHLLFAVIDSGPGISEAEQAIIFAPFRQTERGVQHAGGTGLGLPITKRLAETHGGKLWLESTLGEGSAFFIELPVQAVETPITKSEAAYA